jgi:hypothetical protein
VGHDARGAIVLRQKWSRGQVEARLANIADSKLVCDEKKPRIPERLPS